MQRFSMLTRHFIGLFALAVALLTFGSASLVTSTAAPSAKKPAGGELTSTVEGTVQGDRALDAEFIPKSFKTTKDGGMTVKGHLVGTIDGVGDFKKMATFDVESINGTPVSEIGTSASDLALMSSHGCDVLNLVLGPLDLNLLGLQVDLAQVVLDIVAVPGAGNLLGNLLCAVAGLLDGGSPLNNLLRSVTNLLNQILGALNAAP